MKAFLKKIYDGWMIFAHALGRIQTFLILSVIYVVVVGTISAVYRVFAGDPLNPRGAATVNGWTTKAKSNGSLAEARQIF